MNGAGTRVLKMRVLVVVGEPDLAGQLRRHLRRRSLLAVDVAETCLAAFDQ